MLKQRMISNALVRSSAACQSKQWSNHSRAPNIGPPLYAVPLQRSPCKTPALDSSKARYNASWNLSLILDDTMDACKARPIMVCVWLGW